MDAKCSFCNSKIMQGDAVINCPKCEVLFHPNCWDENGKKCSIYGCGEVVTAEKKEVAITDEDKKKADEVISNLCFFSWLTVSPPILFVLSLPSVYEWIKSPPSGVIHFIGFLIWLLSLTIFCIGTLITGVFLLVRIISSFFVAGEYIRDKIAANIARKRITSISKK
ncbi:MAG: RING finger protein [bacterium]|nr:RING finger protein [bacterium]